MRGVRGSGSLHRGIAFHLVQVGKLGNEADGAAHGARAIEGTLRSAQHLDVLQVVHTDIRLETAAVVRVRAADHGLTVVDTGRRGARGVDPANDVLLVT